MSRLVRSLASSTFASLTPAPHGSGRRRELRHAQTSVMRAAIARNQVLVVDEIDDPVPGPGDALVRVVACGICGSDLHALVHADELVAAVTTTRRAAAVRSDASTT